MTVRGVSREAAIADYGVVLTGEPDEDLVSYDAAATARRGTAREIRLSYDPAGGVERANPAHS